MIKVEPCKGCGGVLLVDRFMGVVVRCDPTPVDAQTAGRALIASVPLYRVHTLGGRPSSFGSASTAVLAALRTEPSERPMVVPEHRCNPKATGAVLPASQTTPAQPVQPVTANPPAGRTAPSSGPSRTPDAVRPALRTESTRSDHDPVGVLTFDVDPRNPRCKRCGQRMAQGTYAAIELGELLVYAEHIEECERNSP